MVEDGFGEHGSSIPSARESGNEGAAVTATVVVAAVIERSDRRILIGQRRRDDTSPLKWEFPGGKVRSDEKPEEALARELQEELGATLQGCVEIGRVRHAYPSGAGQLEIRFYAAEISDTAVEPKCFEQIAWVLPKELGNYDFLEANRPLIAQIATGKEKPAELLRSAKTRK
jgi:8-oxo-dGTP diphosphatase